MNPLLLGGYGVRVRVSRIRSLSELWIMDGRRDRDLERMFRLQPRRCPYDSIVIDGHSGYITLQALHWLSRNKVPVFVMNYDGALISSILPPTITQAHIRRAQFQAANERKRKFRIAKALVQAKIARSLYVLEYFAQGCDIEKESEAARREAKRLPKASTIAQLRTVEGRVALGYWAAYRKALPEPLGFQGRMTTTRQSKASDPVNLALNYGYGFLEAECRKAINAIGLEPSVGYLHEFSDYQTKQSLVYDLQEPFRFLVDLTVMQAFDSGALDANSFYFTEHDYRLRFQSEAKGRFLTALRERFNSGVRYKGQRLRWDTVVEQKAVELGRYLVGRTGKLNFSDPSPNLIRTDDGELRRRILNLSQSRAEKLGIGKSTLHYLRKNARGDRSFSVYKNVHEKLKSGKNVLTTPP
jgi:CRISPR-associated protein Cas1